MSIDEKIFKLKQEVRGFDSLDRVFNGDYETLKAGDIKKLLRAKMSSLGLDLRVETIGYEIEDDGSAYAMMEISLVDVENDQARTYSWVGEGYHQDAGKALTSATTSGLKNFVRANFLTSDSDGDIDLLEGDTQGGNPKSPESNSEASQGTSDSSDDEVFKKPPTEGQKSAFYDILSQFGDLKEEVKQDILDNFRIDTLDDIGRREMSASMTWMLHIHPNRTLGENDVLQDAWDAGFDDKSDVIRRKVEQQGKEVA